MASVHIKRSHQLERDRVRHEVEQLADKLATELSASYSWKGDRLEFKRSGANGFIDIGKHELEIEIKLGMLLTPLKSTIETRINDYLDKALA